MKVRAHVFVRGNVQGVFFRSETVSEARTHNVNGWVRNLPDGRVEAIFEGEQENVQILIEFCRRGPPGAHVSGIDVEYEMYRGEFTDFDVTY